MLFCCTCCLPWPSALAVMQDCQYIKTQKATTGLGRVNNNTVWEINNLAAEKFQFVVTYHDGEGGRYNSITHEHIYT